MRNNDKHGNTFFNKKEIIRFYEKNWGEYPIDEMPLNKEKIEEVLVTNFSQQVKDIQSHRNKFGLIFQIHHPENKIIKPLEISYWIEKNRFNDANVISFDDFLEEIHPHYFQTYTHHAHAAYRTVARIFREPEHLSILPTQFTLRLPIRRKCADGENKYWWMYQDAFVFHINKSGRLATHFNAYTIRGVFDDRNYQNNAGAITLQPTILHYPEYKINKAYKKIFQEEFYQAFLEVCSEREKVIIDGIDNGLDRKTIADSLGLELQYLNKMVIPKILHKATFNDTSDYPLFPFKKFSRINAFVNYLKNYDPFA